MRRIVLLISFLTFQGILFAQQPADSCVIKVPTQFKKEGCGSQQIRMHFESNCPVHDLEITIYNRWGNVIYISDQLDHQWQEGEKTPGTYYFRITGAFSNGNKIDQNGYFNIVE